MSESNFSTGFTVDNTPAEVFAAVLNPRGWWSAGIEGVTDRSGEDFVFQVPGVHYSQIKVTELVPGERVVWRVVEATMLFVADRDEWTGTEIRFEISPSDSGTELRFTHDGLVPSVECYDACSNAWGQYIGGSLRNFVTTGVGSPDSNPDEERYREVARSLT